VSENVKNLKNTTMNLKFSPTSIFLITFMLLFSGLSKAQQSIQVTPSKFIAYSLYNFSKFIDWPNDINSTTFQIGIVGDRIVYNELVKLSENKKQRFGSYQITFYKNVSEINGFNHIIYLSNLNSGKVKELANSSSNKGVLFVTEREGMSKQGSIISFLTDANGMMGFEIAMNNAIKNNLSVQKQLEKLATRVM
jgi:hypothetical protein